MTIFIEAAKSDYEAVEALNREFPDAGILEKNSFSGSEIMIYAIPAMAILFG